MTTQEITYKQYRAQAQLIRSLRRKSSPKSLARFFNTANIELMEQYDEIWKRECADRRIEQRANFQQAYL